VNPLALLRVEPAEFAVLQRVLERADHWRFELDRRLARMIVAEYAEWRRRSERRR
jgi:hypothetical protein